MTLGELIVSFGHLNDQVKRLVSHWDSEDRQRERLKDRVGQIEKTLIRMEEKIDGVITIINNGGVRLDVKVDRLMQEKERVRWTWDRVISIAATVAVIIIEIVRGK